jgi:hypothetical protein
MELTGLFCFSYDVDGHCQHILLSAASLAEAAAQAAAAAPEDWAFLGETEIDLHELSNGVALPWF